MTVSETFQVVASTPPADLPHTTAAAEIARLPDYLSVTHQRDSGTDYIVTDAAYKDEAGNAGRIYVQRSDTDNSIEAIQSKVGGVWTNWEVPTDSIADDAVTTDKILDKNVTGMKLADGIAGDGLKFTDTTVGAVTARVMHADVDGTSLVVDETTNKLRIKTGATGVVLSLPTVNDQISLNTGTPAEIRIGSNVGDWNHPADSAHGWIGSWNGAPVDVYIENSTSTTLYQLHHDWLSITQNGQTVKLSIDAEGNVFQTTTGGGSQNVVWRNSRISGGVAMLLEASEGALTVNKINAAALSFTGAPTTDPHVAGRIWSNDGVVTISAG